jgi:hypothetical protein
MSGLETAFNDSTVMSKSGTHNGASKTSIDNNDQVDDVDETTLSLLREMHIQPNQAEIKCAAQISKSQTDNNKEPTATEINNDDARAKRF